MTDSTLAREATIPTPPKGHDPAALGPSDSSDTGSDIAGAPGHPLDDAELAGDSDRNGTGERAGAGDGTSLPTDVLLHVEDGTLLDAEDLVDEDDDAD